MQYPSTSATIRPAKSTSTTRRRRSRSSSSMRSLGSPRSLTRRRRRSRGRDPVRALPFDRRRLVCTGHWQATGRVANRDLNVGAIVALAPISSRSPTSSGVDVETVKKVLDSWGPGRYRRQPGQGRQGIPTRRQTGRHVDPAGIWPRGREPAHVDRVGIRAVLERLRRRHEMHGTVRSTTRASAVKTQFRSRPRADRGTPMAGPRETGRPRNWPRCITTSCPFPRPGRRRDRSTQRQRTGRVLFISKRSARAATCRRSTPNRATTSTRPKRSASIQFQADRSPTKRYRTAPLAGLWSHQKGGFYHDGRFATIGDVINHYNDFFGLNLSSAEKQDLVQFLLSI